MCPMAMLAGGQHSEVEPPCLHTEANAWSLSILSILSALSTPSILELGLRWHSPMRSPAGILGRSPVVTECYCIPLCSDFATNSQTRRRGTYQHLTCYMYSTYKQTYIGHDGSGRHWHPDTNTLLHNSSKIARQKGEALCKELIGYYPARANRQDMSPLQANGLCRVRRKG
jgi:hypothetical protein